MTNSYLNYLTGFGSHWQSEAVPGALPLGQNSPQKPPLGLYAEQLSGSAFTQQRSKNFRAWLYKILPSVVQEDFKLKAHNGLTLGENPVIPPNQLRWDPTLSFVQGDWVDSLQAMAFNGSPQEGTGGVIYTYACQRSMEDAFVYNSDGEFLIVPVDGALEIHTEMGLMRIQPKEIACIPRGIKFQVKLNSQNARGYVLENFGQPLTLPNLGPIGSNGLANPRDFKIPVAHFEQKRGDFILYNKFGGKLWQASLDYHPLNTVAWHGNYAPYKYDLTNFNTINTVSFDHPDPSIFTVLTSESAIPGVANIDFVIFPERWMVAENTFRPPYYHRNMMSEFMGLIYGEYDAKSDGFAPGGASLHNCMSSHGPDADTFEKATDAEDTPTKQTGTLAFMFESSKVWTPTDWALETPLLQKDYMKCWQPLKEWFNLDLSSQSS